VVIYGPAYFLLGVALIVIVLSARRPIPAWARWATAVAAVAGLVAIVFLPHFLVLLWAVVIGVWLLIGRRDGAAGANVP
jgi:hypothetical protein